jgi:hypothetical protein
MVYRAPAHGSDHRDLILRRHGAQVVLTDALTGRVLSSHRLAALSGIAIEGANGAVDNTLTVDLSGGPLDVMRGVSWDGGVGGYNTLNVRGGGVARASDLALGPHSGVYTVGSTRIVYSHIAPIDDSTPAAMYTFEVPSGTTSVTVSNGALPDTLTIDCLQGSLPSAEQTTIANKAQVVIQSGSSDATDEAWALDAATSSTGLASIAFKGGVGANSLVVDAYPVGVPLTTTQIATITPGSASYSATEGAPMSSTTVGTFTDANPTAAVSAYTASVDWDDGSPSTSGTITSGGITEPGGLGTPYVASLLVAGSHTYAEEGSHTTAIDVSSTDGSAATLISTATVADAPLTSGTPVGVTATERAPFLGPVGTFTDADPIAPVSDFTASVSWGDGSGSSAGTISQPGGIGTAFDVSGAHTYAMEGRYGISVSVADVGGSTTLLTATATVAAVPTTGLPPETTTTTVPTTTKVPPPRFPGAATSHPDGAIVRFGTREYVFAGGRAFSVPAAELGKLREVDHAVVASAAPGAIAPTQSHLRPGTLLTAGSVDHHPTIYVAGDNGELYGFASSHQFLTGGFDRALVVTVPSLGHLTLSASTAAAAHISALSTRADGAIVESGRTFYVFAGGRAFAVPTPAALEALRGTDGAQVLKGTVNSLETGARLADGVLLSVHAKGIYVSYHGKLFPFRSMAQLTSDGYGGTRALTVPGTWGVSVVYPYSGL